MKPSTYSSPRWLSGTPVVATPTPGSTSLNSLIDFPPTKGSWRSYCIRAVRVEGAHRGFGSP